MNYEVDVHKGYPLTLPVCEFPLLSPEAIRDQMENRSLP